MNLSASLDILITDIKNSVLTNNFVANECVIVFCNNSVDKRAISLDFYCVCDIINEYEI